MIKIKSCVSFLEIWWHMYQSIHLFTHFVCPCILCSVLFLFFLLFLYNKLLGLGLFREKVIVFFHTPYWIVRQSEWIIRVYIFSTRTTNISSICCWVVNVLRQTKLSLQKKWHQSILLKMKLSFKKWLIFIRFFW